MNKKIDSTTNRWNGEYKPEIGNLASVGNIRRSGAYGTVTEIVDAGTVKVVWYAAKQQRRAHAENKRNQAVRRVTTNDRLQAVGL